MRTHHIHQVSSALLISIQNQPLSLPLSVWRHSEMYCSFFSHSVRASRLYTLSLPLIQWLPHTALNKRCSSPLHCICPPLHEVRYHASTIRLLLLLLACLLPFQGTSIQQSSLAAKPGTIRSCATSLWTLGTGQGFLLGLRTAEGKRFFCWNSHLCGTSTLFGTPLDFSESCRRAHESTLPHLSFSLIAGTSL